MTVLTAGKKEWNVLSVFFSELELGVKVSGSGVVVTPLVVVMSPVSSKDALMQGSPSPHTSPRVSPAVADWPTGTPGNFPVRPWLIHSLTPLFEHNFEENDKTIEVKLYMERY